MKAADRATGLTIALSGRSVASGYVLREDGILVGPLFVTRKQAQVWAEEAFEFFGVWRRQPDGSYRGYFA